MATILVAGSLPDNPGNVGDLRLWHLLRSAQPEVIVTGDDQVTAMSPFRWASRRVVCADLLNICHPPRLATLAAWASRNTSALARVREALREAAVSSGDKAPVYIAAGHVSALSLIANRVGPAVFLTTDSMALYHRRRASALKFVEPARAMNSLQWSRTYRALEREIAESCEATVLIAEADARYISTAASAARLHVVGSGTDWLNRSPVADYRRSANRLTFHGSFNWEPNRLAALYLARKIMPRLRRTLPGAELHIVGSPVFGELAALNGRHGVRAVGHVVDVQQYVGQADLYVMPMLAGSGVKTKLIEAMALGLPVVTNSMGAEALPSLARSAVAVVDGTRQICDELTFLLASQEARRQLGLAARSAAEQWFKWEDYSSRFLEVIKHIH